MRPAMPCDSRLPGLTASYRWTALCIIGFGISACTSSNIWNAGDLAVWVKDRAVERGCERQSIQLDEWYTETPEGNVWRGTCADGQGSAKSFGINVDPVWTPSE